MADQLELRELRSRYLAGDLDSGSEDLVRYWRLEHEASAAARAAWQADAQERAAGISRERAVEVEAQAESGEEMSDEETLDWLAVVEVSKPWSGSESDWDRWYSTPVAEMVFPKVMGRVHQPPRLEARPRGRRSRGRSRARAPARPDDDPPDVDLSALRAISPEAFAHVLRVAGL